MRDGAARHATDGAGRILPDPGWPAGREAPGGVELLRRFLNTTNRENGADRLGDAAGLDAWLHAEGLGAVTGDGDDVARVRAVRELLHRLVVANAERRQDDAAAAALAIAVDDVRFAVVARDGGLALRVAADDPVTELVGRLVLVALEAMAGGTFARLTACPHCRWVVFDGSKNRSARWCSMGACGGRQNARAYRRRRGPGGSSRSASAARPGES